MTREAMPDRRPQMSFQFGRGEKLRFVGSIGFTEDWRPMEVFLSCNKTNESEALGRDAAILISLALQHGCDFESMRGAITRDEDGIPSTLVGQLLDEIGKIDPRAPLGAEVVPIAHTSSSGRYIGLDRKGEL